MSALAIEHVWKRYAVRRDLHGGARARSGPEEALWALQDISFRLDEGGALGLIGANGSGKSTLLALIAGVQRATSGRVAARGRVVAVLNPTAGFHPELTGRANIRLLASLHGLASAEVERRIPAIVDFSGLDAWIDQPVRTYSAGMAIRLGFSTAAHLDADLLVADEVFSAGDLAFQRRTLGLARDLRARGTALLLSTHALGDLTSLVDALLWLDRGQARAHGAADAVVAAYIQRVEQEGGRITPGGPHVPGARGVESTGAVRITAVRIGGAEGGTVGHRAGEPLEVEIDYDCDEPVEDAVFRVQFFRNDGLFVHGQNTARAGLRRSLPRGRGRATLRYAEFGLLGGDYYVAAGIWPDEYRSLHQGDPFDQRPNACVLRVDAPRSMGGGVAGWASRWTVEDLEQNDSLRLIRGERP